jgi:hypothetical protein
MEKLNLYSRYLLAFLFSALLTQGCKREEGYYATPNIDEGTTLDTYDYLKTKPGVYDSLLLLIDKLGMQKTVRDSNITLFAVSNSSFQIAIKNLNDVRKSKGKNSIFLSELSSGKSLGIADLSKAKSDSAHLDTMVARYIIKELYKSTDFSVGEGRNIYSVRGNYPMHGKRLYADAQGMQNGGSEILEFANTKRSVFVASWSLATTNSVNIKTKNGIVHLLEPNHVFGFDEFVNRLTFIPPPTNLFKNTGSDWFVQFEDPTAVDGSISAGEKFIKVHDGNALTKFLSTFNPDRNKITMTWISAAPIVSNVYTLTSANDAQARDPKSWRLEGSNDGKNFVLLDTRQDMIFESRFQNKIFEFNNDVPYKYYRIIILTNRGDNLFQLAEWTMNFKQVYK